MARFRPTGRGNSGRRWRWGRRILAAIFFGALAAGAYYVVGFTQSSEEFNLTTVRLEGLKVLTEEAVLIASGVSSGDSVLRLERAKIEAGIETLPYVEAAEVVIVFPDTMIVRVKERTPAATLIVRNAAYEIDRSGVVLRRYPEGLEYISPLITNVGGLDVVEAGDSITVLPLHSALEAWDAFQSTSMSKDLTLSEIAAPSADEIVMLVNELPYEIRWGRGDMRTAAQRLDMLWRERSGDLGCTEYLDLRFGEDIVCK